MIDREDIFINLYLIEVGLFVTFGDELSKNSSRESDATILGFKAAENSSQSAGENSI
jgi:hypothetical protein